MITLIGAALVVLSPIFAPVAIAQSPDDVSKICSAARLDVRGRPGDDAILIDAAMAKRFATDDVIKIAGRGGDDSIVFSVEASDAAAVAGWLICASGGPGNDLLDLTDAVDVASGDSGDDIIFSYRGNDQISGGSGDDQLGAGGGDDVVTGGRGNDTLYGDSGDDYLDGGRNSDLVHSGQGIDSARGGSGHDLVVGETSTHSTADGDLELIGGGGAKSLWGNNGADVIVGGDSGDVIYGGRGADLLVGRAGNDRLFGESGRDQLIGGAGRDRLVCGAGRDAASGGSTDYLPGDELLGSAKIVKAGGRRDVLQQCEAVLTTSTFGFTALRLYHSEKSIDHRLARTSKTG